MTIVLVVLLLINLVSIAASIHFWRQARRTEHRLEALQAELHGLVEEEEEVASSRPRISQAAAVESLTPLELVSPPRSVAKVIVAGEDARVALIHRRAVDLLTEAHAVARNLGFDYRVPGADPSVYRTSFDIRTAIDRDAVEHLQEGDFACLASVRIEGERALLHIDTSKLPPTIDD